MAEDLSQADVVLRLPGYSPMPAFKDVVDVPLVVRHARRSREEVGVSTLTPVVPWHPQYSYMCEVMTEIPDWGPLAPAPEQPLYTVTFTVWPARTSKLLLYCRCDRSYNCQTLPPSWLSSCLAPSRQATGA